jgi:PAS domain S-box-containing protein
MYRLYGRTRSEGRQPYSLWTDSLHPDDRARVEQERADAVGAARPFETEFRIIRPNGDIRYLRSVADTTVDANGVAAGLIGVNFDITERRRADEQFRLAIEAAPTGMLLMNLSGFIVLVNQQVENLFGYSRAELLGQRIELLVPERFRATHAWDREGFCGAPSTRKMGSGRELYGLCKDGSEVPVEIALNPIQTIEGQFVLSSIVDLSVRREVDRMRADFVSVVSHELRTPLTSIMGSLGLLQSGAMGPVSKSVAEMIRIAHNNSGRLVRIINDILDIGKIEAGQLPVNMVSVEMAGLLQLSIEANAGYARKCQVRLLLEELCDGARDARVLADPDRLMQVLNNLLSNAAKFSPQGADVLVRLIPRETDVRVEVRDSGPGISEQFKERIFEKFAQADASSTRRFDGTGLGLSISRGLIEAMGGVIGFSSGPAQGSIFFFELARLRAATDAPQCALSDASARQLPVASAGGSADAAASAVPRVLHVEDDADLNSIMAATYDGRADMLAVATLQGAERLIRQERFDLIVLDHSLLAGNGVMVIERVPVWAGRPIPVIIFSATEVPSEIRSRVAAVLVKSKVSPEQTVTRILSHIPARDMSSMALR